MTDCQIVIVLHSDVMPFLNYTCYRESESESHGLSTFSMEER